MENTRHCVYCRTDISHKRLNAQYCSAQHKRNQHKLRARGFVPPLTPKFCLCGVGIHSNAEICAGCKLKTGKVMDPLGRDNLRRHGITWEEKCWLVYVHQNNACSLCLRPLTVEGAVIDHHHDCLQAGTHQRGRGCRKCIRGALHMACNSPVLMVIEKNPHLQNDFIRVYLAGRPFLFSHTPKNNA